MNLDIVLTKLVIRNFLSYGNNETEVRLDFNTPTLIVGRNLDAIVNGQVDSNGSGKTVLLNAISYALYDKTISDIAKPRLINHSNKKNMSVSLEFTKNKNLFYKVVRFRKNAPLGGDGIKVYQRSGDNNFTEKDEISPDSIGNATAWIAGVIGVPFDVFSRIVIFSAAHQPFLMLPASSTGSAANQRDVIEELFGITELSQKAEILKTQIKESKKVFDNLLEINDTLKSERAKHGDLLQSVKTQLNVWNARHADDIQAYQLQVDTLSEIDLEEQVKLYEKRTTDLNKLTTYEIELKNYRLEDIKRRHSRGMADGWDKLHADNLVRSATAMSAITEIDFDTESAKFDRVDSITKEIAQHNTVVDSNRIAVNDGSKKKTKLESELEHLKDSNCPYCKQTFSDAKLRIGAIEDELASLTVAIAAGDKAIDDNVDAIEDLEAAKKLLTANFPYRSISELQREVARIDAVKRSHEEIQKATNPRNKEELDEEITTCQSNISVLESNITKVKTRITKVESALEFKSEKEAIESSSKLEAAKKRLADLNASVNPHLATHDKIAKTKFEDLKDDEINTLDDVIEHQNFLLKLLTKKDSFIRKLLLQKNLPFLNSRLKIYLDKLGLPHRVHFMEDLQVKITQFGSETEYGGMSSGQRARINLALSFAFRDVLQARHGRINFCILDECLDVGLGTVGVQVAAELIKSIAIQDKLSMFVITHKDEISSMFDSRLEIELENGFSRIVNVE